MNVARLKTVKGEVIAEIPLPMSAADVPLSRYVSFLNELKKLELDDQNPMQIMAQAVGEFSGLELGEVLRAKVGEQWKTDAQLDGGIRSLYGWCVNALTNYKGHGRKPDNFTFEYRGETYRIPYIVASELAGGLSMLPEVETGEAIEAYETLRGFRQQIKDAGDPTKERAKRIKQLKEAIINAEDKDCDMAREIRRLEAETELTGDPNGNLLFAQYLRLISIFARKEPKIKMLPKPEGRDFYPDEAAALETIDRMPANDGDRERWIQTRMIYFQGIDTATALDVDFFLTGLLTISKKTHPVIGSLSLPFFMLVAANQSRQQQKGKRTIAQWRTKKKSKSGLVGVQLSKPLLKKGGLIIPK